MTGIDFGNVSKKDVRADKITSYTIPNCELDDAEGIAHLPTLYGRTTSDKNVRYRAAVRKENAKVAGGLASKDAQFLEQHAREVCRRLFPDFILTGWDDVYNASGEMVPFTPDAARAFLRALPNHHLSGVILHFGNPLNFTGDDVDDDLTPAAMEDVAGN